ncbi:uncharacterized protein BJ171DRAFT_418357 [Polychytrium aggregatum]|uniref:uncharacterized protein n=1 Tax=Polychytrium aggregatum TaxID=110093 RepID=UPI0022FE7FE3|nr:uncharacterized protein BJ171DRAFT_418357 [Polychytrium aggregatum]KAI9209518.1 hypothetical protein BJ171DRAFT_418357 [Polychytrium aggregatum]
MLKQLEAMAVERAKASQPGPSDGIGPQQKDSKELWEQFNSTPLFMNSLPEDAEQNETLMALQSLIYDGTQEEIAENFKNQGNEAFKDGPKRYKDAIGFYTQGIDAKANDDALNSVLFSNRAAVNLELGNYRRTLNDCASALKFNPANVKAYYRSAKACLALDKYEEALDCCERGLLHDPQNKALVAEKGKVVKKMAERDEKQRRQREREALKKQQEERIKAAIELRGIRLITNAPKIDPDTEEVTKTAPHPLADEHRVRFDAGSDQLVWPVLFLYPEYHDSDLITQFYEDDTFAAHLAEMFAEPPQWDAKREYNPDTLEMYFETRMTEEEIKRNPKEAHPRLLKIGRDMKLIEVLSHPDFRVVDGVPTFFVVAGGSAFAKAFRKSYKKKTPK